MITKRTLPVATLFASLVFATNAWGVHSVYRADLTTLNNSGVTGYAMFEVNPVTRTLSVEVNAMGLEPDMDHLMHLHGLIDGDGTSGNPAVDSQTPTLADDADGDGFVEVFEGLPQYGDIILTLGTQTAPGGSFAYSETFDLDDDSLFGSPVGAMMDYVGDDLLPLEFREIVIHGLTVDGSVGAGTDGEVDGTAGYKAVLPVAAGEIYQVPEPTSAVLMMLGVAGVVGGLRRR